MARRMGQKTNYETTCMTDSKKGEGVFTLLDVDATPEEIEAFSRALGWTPEMGEADEVTNAKESRAQQRAAAHQR
jgi:hypothetical protein